MLDIALHAAMFDAIGTKVLVCRDLDLLETIMDKGKFYESVKETGIMTIPDYHVVSTAEQFKEAYHDLVAKGHRVCFKPTETEGASASVSLITHVVLAGAVWSCNTADILRRGLSYSGK